MVSFRLLHEHQPGAATAGLVAAINGIVSCGVGGGGCDDDDSKPVRWEANQEGVGNDHVWLLEGTHMRNPTWSALLVLPTLPLCVWPMCGCRLFY
jgi:hypothetical protein